ncbi:MAG: M1 family metallopeptidase, partial [Nannocystaceae bacterium]
APLRLDTRDLKVDTVALLSSDGAATPATFRLGDADPVLGRALEIDLAADTERVMIEFQTLPEGSGLQWLSPEQTAGKSKPFLYSQSQAIHARTWWPCQDTPGVRMTYRATVKTPAGLVATMSAAQATDGSDPSAGVFEFVMEQPIPAYLVALAVGDLEFRALSERAGVWAEPSVLDRGASELQDLEAMMKAAESLYGPYQWDRYDVLFLPPAFPFGGMENPRLTFATPTILAGDRSLVGLIAHELAHSWSGNLVTNVQWSEIWLNEGFTTYFERRLMEALYGVERANMEWSLGFQDLQATLAETADAPKSQWLHLDLVGEDPDAGLSDVAYEKGALFLRTLEHRYGRERFDRFLRAWFDQHAFTSVTTAEFIRFVTANLLDGAPADGGPQEDVEAWIHGPGVPPSAHLTPTAAFSSVDELRASFLENGEVAPLRDAAWSAHEWLHFLRGIPAGVSTERLSQLDEGLDFSHSANYELLAEWLEISIRERYAPAQPAVEEFLLEVGRRKFLVPLYRALSTTDLERAKAIYARARPGYHAISQGTLDAMLNVK